MEPSFVQTINSRIECENKSHKNSIAAQKNDKHKNKCFFHIFHPWIGRLIWNHQSTNTKDPVEAQNEKHFEVNEKIFSATMFLC